MLEAHHIKLMENMFEMTTKFEYDFIFRRCICSVPFFPLWMFFNIQYFWYTLERDEEINPPLCDSIDYFWKRQRFAIPLSLTWMHEAILSMYGHQSFHHIFKCEMNGKYVTFDENGDFYFHA